MPLLIIPLLVASLVSLAMLGLAGYMAWSWYEGADAYNVDGDLVRVREDWRLWLAALVLAWSLFGRFAIGLVLGRSDDEQSRITLTRSEGEFIDTPTGASVYVERIGNRDKPTLIFTHGWGLDSTIWQYAKRDLAREFHLVFWDLPGLGKSKRGADGQVNPARYAMDLEAVMDFAAAENIVLVGHSIGGMTIQSLVQDAPERVRRDVAGIVLLNTTYTNPIKTAFGSGVLQALRWPLLEPVLFLTRILQPVVWLDAWRTYLSGFTHLANRIQFGRTVTRSQLNAVALLGTRNPPGVLAGGNLGMFRWDATGAMAGFRGPVLVIGGTMDLATKIDASRVIAADALGSQLMEVEGVNHLGFIENAPTYNEAIARFAKSVTEKRLVQQSPAVVQPAAPPRVAV